MAFYDYFCEKCGFIKEVQHSITASPIILCEECSTTLKRTIGVPHVYINPSDDKCTLGTLADRNAERFSPEHKEYLKEKNRTKKRSELNQTFKQDL